MQNGHSHLGPIAFVLFLGVAALGSCGRDPQKAKQNYLESGIHYLEKGKYPEATIQFQNALKIDPRFVEALFQLGKAHIANRDQQRAYAALQQALDLDPARLDIRLSLAGLYLTAREYAKAEELATFIIAKNPRETQAYHLLGVSLMMHGENERARGALAKVIEAQPNDPAAYINLALVETTLGKRQEAESHFIRAVEVGPKFSQAYSNLASFYRIGLQFPRAEQVLEQGLEENPDDTGLYITLADMFDITQRRNAADSVLTRLRMRRPRAVEAALAIGDFYYKHQEMDKALGEYRRALGIDPKNLAIKNHVVECYLAAGRDNEAEEMNREVLRSRPQDIQAQIGRGRVLLAKGKSDEAISALRAVVAQAQDSMEAHYYLAMAYWRKNTLPLAKTELQQALRLAPEMVMVRHRLAELHIALGELAAARELAENLVKQRKASPAERLLLGIICLRQGQIARSREQLLISRKLSPGDAAIPLNLALGYSIEHKWAEAEQEFESALRLDPRYTEALDQFARYWARRQHPSKAVARVKQYLAENPADAGAHLILGSLSINSKEYGLAKSELERALELNPKLVQAHVELGDVYRLQGAPDAAIQQYEKAIALDPRLLALYTLLGDLYLGQQNKAMAEKNYMQALALNPNSAAAANNLAWMYVKQGGNLDVALGLAQRAKAVQPELASITDTLGWIEYKKGFYSGSISLLLECVAKSPQSAVYRYHLGMALLATGAKQDARVQLQRALQLKLIGDDAGQAQLALSRIN